MIFDSLRNQQLLERIKEQAAERRHHNPDRANQSLLERIKQSHSPAYRPSQIYNPIDPGVADLVITQVKNRHRKQTVDPALDVSQILDDYHVFVNDGTVINPFVISSELIKIVKEHTRYLTSDEEKSRAIFDWIEENIAYGTSRRYHGYSNSREVLENEEGVCGEMAFVYITMARSLRLNSSYASIKVDCSGKRVNHGCAAVNIGYRDILVDPAYHLYDAKHEKYEILTDRQIINKFRQWRF